MGNVHMEASQINYRGGNSKMSVEEAIKNAGNAGLAHTADIAPEFSATSAYTAGDIVYHDGSLYEFTANHAAGAWSTSDTQAVTVGGKIESLEGDVASLSSAKANQITIAPTFSAETSYDPGDLVFYNGAAYRCVNAHEGAWDADDFSATTVANELSTLMSGLTNITTLTAQYISGVNGQINAANIGKILLVTGYFKASSDISTDTVLATISNVNIAYAVYCDPVGDQGNAGRLELVNSSNNAVINSKYTLKSTDYYQYTFIAFLS